MAITQADIDSASMDPDTKIIVIDLLARIAALEVAPLPIGVEGPNALVSEFPDGTIVRYEKV